MYGNNEASISNGQGMNIGNGLLYGERVIYESPMWRRMGPVQLYAFG